MADLKGRLDLRVDKQTIVRLKESCSVAGEQVVNFPPGFLTNLIEPYLKAYLEVPELAEIIARFNQSKAISNKELMQEFLDVLEVDK